MHILVIYIYIYVIYTCMYIHFIHLESVHFFAIEDMKASYLGPSAERPTWEMARVTK